MKKYCLNKNHEMCNRRVFVDTSFFQSSSHLGGNFTHRDFSFQHVGWKCITRRENCPATESIYVVLKRKYYNKFIYIFTTKWNNWQGSSLKVAVRRVLAVRSKAHCCSVCKIGNNVSTYILKCISESESILVAKITTVIYLETFCVGRISSDQNHDKKEER